MHTLYTEIGTFSNSPIPTPKRKTLKPTVYKVPQYIAGSITSGASNVAVSIKMTNAQTFNLATPLLRKLFQDSQREKKIVFIIAKSGKQSKNSITDDRVNNGAMHTREK